MMYFSNRGGFTLVETLVAISILLLVVIGPITVAQRGIKSAYYANEQVTAVFLAQEAVEAIRELRDTNALGIYGGGAGGTWDWKASLKSSVSDCFDSNDGCAFDPESGNFESCDSNNGCQLYVNRETGEYSYSNAEGFVDSGYTRKVYLNDTAVTGAVSVTVEVDWDSRTFGGSNPGQKVVLKTWLYDHYQRYEDF